MKTSIFLSSISALALSGGLLGCIAGSADDEVGNEAAGATDQAESAFFVAAPPPVPAPSNVYIEGITTGGPGCPTPGDAPTVISPARDAFLVIFNKMFLNYPPAPLVKNLNCVAGVQLHIPAGWQFSVATVNTRGYAFLEPGMQARQTSKYFFAGNPIATAWHSTLYGYFDASYSFTDNIGFGSWSACGGSAIFAIDTSINLNAIGNPGGNGYMNTETVDGAFQKVFYWSWRPC